MLSLTCRDPFSFKLPLPIATTLHLHMYFYVHVPSSPKDHFDQINFGTLSSTLTLVPLFLSLCLSVPHASPWVARDQTPRVPWAPTMRSCRIVTMRRMKSWNQAQREMGLQGPPRRRNRSWAVSLEPGIQGPPSKAGLEWMLYCPPPHVDLKLWILWDVELWIFLGPRNFFLTI